MRFSNFELLYRAQKLIALDSSISGTLSVGDFVLDVYQNTPGPKEVDFESEIIGENLVVTLKLNPLTEQVVGTQFKINYDTDKLTYTTTQFTNTMINNFHTNRGNFINVGSISTDGSILLDKTTQYKLIFKTKDVVSGFGLVSIKPVDAINKDGKQLKIIVK